MRLRRRPGRAEVLPAGGPAASGFAWGGSAGAGRADAGWDAPDGDANARANNSVAARSGAPVQQVLPGRSPVTVK